MDKFMRLYTKMVARIVDFFNEFSKDCNLHSKRRNCKIP
jgi:hypothetical protein